LASMRDIRRRIKSVSNTQKITKAMKMVSASKYRKTQNNLIASRPYIHNIEEIMYDLLESGIRYDNPLMEKRSEVKNILYIVIAGDRGLCGGYNINILREAAKIIDERPEGTQYSIITLGIKATEYFKNKNYNVVQEFSDIGDCPTVSHSRALSRNVMKQFLDGEYDEVYMVYNKFNSVLSQTPTLFQVLPVNKENIGIEKELEYINDFIFEPNETAIMDVLFPMYVFALMYRAILEAKTGEHGARMTSMDSATDNATELIDKLTLSLNRARQAAITTEITEIVGGAAALE
jgi:F-type H+-transporting ATPase subunit gamma